MNKFIHLLLLAIFASSIAGCGSVPASDQRTRAEKAQSELGAEVSKQK